MIVVIISPDEAENDLIINKQRPDPLKRTEALYFRTRKALSYFLEDLKRLRV